MKEYSLSLSTTLVNIAQSPIRSRLDIINLLLSTVKEYIVADPNYDVRECVNIAKICIDRFKRIFFSFENKIFSVSFPFNVAVKDDGVNSYFYFEYQNIVIDNKLTSVLISVFSNQNDLQNTTSKDIYSVVADVCNEFGIKTVMEILEVQKIVYYLLTYEDGYFRYDFDTERDDSIYHPKNHFDLYYSNSNTFKIGLKDKINLEWFINFSNNNAPVAYIES